MCFAPCLFENKEEEAYPVLKTLLIEEHCLCVCVTLTYKRCKAMIATVGLYVSMWKVLYNIYIQ